MVDSQGYTGIITIWPEWLEQDLLLEKWNTQAGPGTASIKDPKSKGTSFEDPEGRTRLPHSLALQQVEWKRPQELFGDNMCIVRNTNYINLKEPNEHLKHSEFIRHYLSHIMLLWYNAQRKKLNSKKAPVANSNAIPVIASPSEVPQSAKSSVYNKDSKHNMPIKDVATTGAKPPSIEPVGKALCFDDPMNDWAPWNLIYGGPPQSATKIAVGKGEALTGHPVVVLPQYNPYGKYAVKLFWMGSWRKIIVDDFIPVDEKNRSLLPVCKEKYELWPIILTKAVLKVVSLDFGGGTVNSEVGDHAFILSVLTGYVPCVAYLDHPLSTRKAVWNKLQAILPLNKKATSEDILSALATNWDVRNARALKAWKTENEPDYIKKIESIRALRIQSSTANSQGVGGGSFAQVLEKTPSMLNTLTPKTMARSASARSTSAAPRKLDFSISPNAVVQSPSSQDTQKAPKAPKTPEVIVYATYRSAHHDHKIFDPNAASRSDKLYSNGFLRTESHPILLRQLKDIYPREVTASPVPKFKLFRPLKNVFPSFSKEITRARKKTSRPVRSVNFLSLFWTDKGRLIHQSANRAATLAAHCTLTCNDSDEEPTQPRYKPMDGYKPTLPALPENSQYPRKRIKPPPEPPNIPVSPPPTPAHDDKSSVKHSKPADAKPGVPPPPEVAPLPSVCPPPKNTASLQKNCKLNKGSLEFNQFYNSLETVYVFYKPETFDFQSSFSFYQPNILADGRPPPTKKKNNEAQQQNVEKTEGLKSAPTSTKSPVSPVPVKYGKVTTDLPCPLLFVDNPYPTNLVLSVAALCRWFYIPKTDIKSQEKLSIVAGTMEELKNSEKPLPLMVLLKPFDWMRITTTQPTLWTLKTSSVQGVCYHIPAGRHIFRLKVVCPGRKDLEPHGFFIRAFSRDPVQIGTEDTILKLLGSDSYQYSALARKSLIPILRWWKLNGTVNFSHPPHRDVINVLGLDEDAHDKHTRRIFFDAMLQAIYSAIQICLKEFCTSKVIFALRVFLGDVVTKNPLNLTAAQLAKRDSRVITVPPAPTKAESHSAAKQVEGPPLGKRGKKGGGAESALPSARNQRELNKDNPEKEAAKIPPIKKERPTKPDLNPQQAKAITYWQLYFQVAKASAIREARKSGSKKKEQVLKTAQELLDTMLKNEYLFANCFFRTLCRNLPENWLDLSFFYNQEKRFVFREYSGNFPELPAHNWKLFFRDTFVVNEPMAIAFKLTTNVIPCRLTVVDNDTGEVCPSALFHPIPHFYEKNNNGYSVVAEAKAGTVAWRATSWSLKIIEALDPFKHEVTQADSLLIKFSNPSPTTNFLTKELTDYFLPDTSSSPTIATVLVRVKGPQSIATICFTTSNSDCLLVLTISLDGNPIYKEYGRGTAVVSVYPFKAEAGFYEQYHVRVECLEDSWPLNGTDWKFVYAEKSKRLSVDYGRDSPLPVQSISPVTKEKGGKKGVRSSNSRDKGDKSDKESAESSSAPNSARKKEEKENASIKTQKEVFDVNRPHWNIKFLVDTSDVEFEVKRDAESEEHFKAELTAVLATDVSIIQRGKEQREDFLKKVGNAGFQTPDLPEFPGWTNGSAALSWPAPINRCPLSFDVSQFVTPSAGDGPAGEIDLFVHQNRMARMYEVYEEALLKRNAFVKEERTERDQFIRRQDEFIRKLIDTAVNNRRKYVDQREVFKKEFDEVALEDQRRLVAAQVTSPIPKGDDKHKKGKKG